MNRHTLRRPGRSGPITGLALLIALVVAVPAFAAGQSFSAPPLSAFDGYDRGSGPIKASVTEASWPLAPVSSDQATIDFSVAGIPEPALLSPWRNTYGNEDFGRNETGIGLLGSDKTPLDANKTMSSHEGYIQAESASINWYFGLRTAFISPFTLPYLINDNEKVSLEGPCDLPLVIGTVVDWGDGSAKTTFTSVVPNVPGPVTCSPQGDHIYKQAGDYRVKMSGKDETGGTWAQHFQITVLPFAPNLTQQLAPVLADLSDFGGSGAIAGKLTLERSDSAWIVQGLTMASPDNRVWAKPLYGSYVPDFRPLQDGETFYLIVLVQSNGENCLPYQSNDGPVPSPDFNGYEPCGFYHVTVPITIPAAPGIPLIPFYLLILGVPLLGILLLSLGALGVGPLASFRRRRR